MSIDLATEKEWDALVHRPPHYNQGGMEAIEGNVLKYLHRWRFKNGLQDLKKAQWYLNKMVEEQEAVE